MTEKKKPIFKIIFHNQGKIYEIYARNISHDGLFGFIEVEKIVFGENTSVVVDPTEENLKTEFNGVERTYIPMHSIIRIDQVNKKGTAKITEGSSDGNVMPFPVYTNSSETGK
ncbi:MAG: DUF1820 family protein [Thiotrichales bacterium]|nr:DUF1820 family protein [Thiotrichales bacterium]